MVSGFVSASLIEPMMRAFSRSSTAGGKSGRVSTCSSTSSACFISSALVSVRNETPARSLSKRPPSCAPTSANRREISSSDKPPAPSLSRCWVSIASPDFSRESKPEPAGKSTLTSSIGRSRLSTKYTRAPCFVCQCWIGSSAWAGAHTTKAINAHSSDTILLRMPNSCGRRRRLALERLRIEHRHRESVVDQISLRNVLHLLRGYGLQLLYHEIDRAVRIPGNLERTDLPCLKNDRI